MSRIVRSLRPLLAAALCALAAAAHAADPGVFDDRLVIGGVLPQTGPPAMRSSGSMPVPSDLLMRRPSGAWITAWT